MKAPQGGRRPTTDKATILDVARLAQVSLGTVSYVLSGRRKVGEERRKRVLEAIETLNYVPNSLAQGLRSGQSRLIGICVPNARNAYFAHLMEHLEGLAARDGYEVVQVLSHQDEAIEYRRLEALFAHRLAGLLFVPSAWPSRSFDLIERSGTPTVLLDRATDGSGLDEIIVDNRTAMLETTDRLISAGHRHLLFVVTFPQLVTTQHRIVAFRSVGEGSEGGIRADVMVRGDDPNDFAAQLGQMLAGPDRPTAIIASNTLVALWVIRTLRARELQWPRDVSLVVFEDPEWAALLQPRLTVLEHPTAEMARIAWDLLTERMAGSDAPPRRIELKARIIDGQSIAAPPP